MTAPTVTPAVTEEAVFDAPVAEVWRTVNDHPTRTAWDVFLRRLDVHTSGPTRVGTEVTQYGRWLSGGVSMRVRYTRVHPPSEEDPSAEMEIEMVRGPWFFGRFRAVNRMDPLPGERCLSVGSYFFDVRPRWLAAVVGPIVTAVFAHETRARWAAWRRHVNASVG